MSHWRQPDWAIEAVARQLMAQWEACNGRSPEHFETYQQVFSQLAIPSGFDEVLLVLPAGRVGTLDG